tara:strand:+ start:271 stop:516 length:246 start_codon:yes stop_codon:yes gene_type:complete
MIDTILNTYCEVEFLCKDNSPNWFGPYILIFSTIILTMLEVLNQNGRKTKNSNTDISKPVLDMFKFCIIIFLVSFLIGWIV